MFFCKLWSHFESNSTVQWVQSRRVSLGVQCLQAFSQAPPPIPLENMVTSASENQNAKLDASKMAAHKPMTKMKPHHLDRPLVACCSIGLNLIRHHDWQLTMTQDWSSLCIGGIQIPQLHPHDHDVKRAKWQHLYPRYLASFLNSGRKWRRVVHLYLQSMVWVLTVLWSFKTFCVIYDTCWSEILATSWVTAPVWCWSRGRRTNRTTPEAGLRCRCVHVTSGCFYLPQLLGQF